MQIIINKKTISIFIYLCIQSVMHKQVAIPFGTRNHLSRNHLDHDGRWHPDLCSL